MARRKKSLSQFIACSIALLVFLVLVGGGVYGMVTNGQYGRLWWTMIVMGSVGAIISLMGVADAFNLFDNLIY